jgi:hypothetical protein
MFAARMRRPSFRREFAFVYPKLLPNEVKRSEAKPSQAHRAWQLFPVLRRERL